MLLFFWIIFQYSFNTKRIHNLQLFGTFVYILLHKSFSLPYNSYTPILLVKFVLNNNNLNFKYEIALVILKKNCPKLE